MSDGVEWSGMDTPQTVTTTRWAEGTEEDEGAAIYLMLDGQDTTGIGNIAVWGFGAKCWSGGEWSGWMDTPSVTTTRAPAVLKTYQRWFNSQMLSLIEVNF